MNASSTSVLDAMWAAQRCNKLNSIGRTLTFSFHLRYLQVMQLVHLIEHDQMSHGLMKKHIQIYLPSLSLIPSETATITLPSFFSATLRISSTNSSISNGTSGK